MCGACHDPSRLLLLLQVLRVNKALQELHCVVYSGTDIENCVKLFSQANLHKDTPCLNNIEDETKSACFEGNAT